MDSLTLVPDGGKWLASRPCRFILEEKARGTHWIGSWVGPRTSLDSVETRETLAFAGHRTQIIQLIALLLF